jgi:hypothetical protein
MLAGIRSEGVRRRGGQKVKKSLGIVLLFLILATTFGILIVVQLNYMKAPELPSLLVAGLEGMAAGLIIGAMICIFALIISYVRFHVRFPGKIREGVGHR